MENNKKMLKRFNPEELEQRYEMGWTVKSVKASVKTDSGTLTYDSSKQ